MNYPSTRTPRPSHGLRAPSFAANGAAALMSITSITSMMCASAAFAQTPPPAGDPLQASTLPGWQQCASLGDSTQRLTCYDQLAGQQPKPGQGQGVSAVPAPLATMTPPSSPIDAALPATRVINVANDEGCKDPQYSGYSRFWELETGTDCGTFGIRGYRPISLSYAVSNRVSGAPTSPSPGHTGAFTDYSNNEMRIQLSVRTKIAQGLLTQGDASKRDSVWFGYTQQSAWQLFNGAISRPFRATDHEPEVVYVYPLDWKLGSDWRVRYGGVGLAHQSNGQSLPLSRSWNRVYAMAGLEAGDRWGAQLRLWKRLKESAGNDDNPDISSFIGRGELAAHINLNKDNTIGATLRHSMRSDAKGSVRLEWLRALGNDGESRKSNLRLHTQIFSGYGDSLIDYNVRRTVFSIGLSLVDF